MYNNSGSILEREVYTYSNTIKNQLLNIKTINSNNEVIEIKEITYEETDPFRPSIYKGNTLTWASRRLETYGSNSYRYNSEGIRISKETIEGLYTYIVDQDKIITEIKPNNKKVYYHYDEQNMLVGFSYGTNEYFYIRDITGNIIHIIDKYGNIKVTYKYDAYGKVVKEEGNSELIEINSYLYKGYYYDKETSLYYCNSRYYDPEVKRFISIDDISYLDLETIGGINLYSYCYNNPVNYIDPDGHAPKWWQSILIGVGVIAVAALVTAAIVYTGGGAAAFFAATGQAALGGLKIAAVVGVTAGIVRAGRTAIEGGDIGDVGKSLVLGFSDGFLAGSVYAAGSMLLGAASFRISGLINNGYGWSLGSYSGGYQTPKTPVISLFTIKGGINGGRSFGLDLDIYNSLHFHTNKFGIGKRSDWIKAHHWMWAPLGIGIGVGLSDGWSEW